jgi:hypothetical protein
MLAYLVKYLIINVRRERLDLIGRTNYFDAINSKMRSFDSIFHPGYVTIAFDPFSVKRR